MRAMILAAGRGTRVRPLTERLPKPMIPIMGRPIMEYLIDLLKEAGVDAVLTNLFHLGEAIENYFGDGHRFGVDMIYSYERELLGSGGGLKRVEDFFRDGTFMVLCGDALIDVDIKKAVAFHQRNKALATLILKKTETPERYGIVVVDDEGAILDFQEKPAREEAKSPWANTGIYIFEPQVLDLIPSGRPWDLGGDLFPEIVRRGLPFYGFTSEFSWLDMGTLKDYYEAQMDCISGRVASVKPYGSLVGDRIWSGIHTKIDPRAHIVGPVVLGAACRVEAGASITGPTYIGPGSVIEGGAVVRESVLFPYTRVGADITVVKSIVDRDCVIKAAQSSYAILEPYDNFIVGDSRDETRRRPLPMVGAVSP